VVLVVTSPRVAAGLLSWPAWQRLQIADQVFCADPGPDWLAALHEAGVAVQDVAGHEVGVRAGMLLEATTDPEAGSHAPGREVVWLGSPDGDPGLTDALAEHLARRAVAGRPPEVELVTGSHDVPGSRLLDLVAVMDRLRSPGGCPWDADQTHETLLPFLLEETHEVLEAVELGDRDHLAEELGDLLLQVVFHARLAAEHLSAPFDIDDVAAGIVAKLVRRHPHVFADAEVDDAAHVLRNWEDLKAGEKQREGLFDGIPATLPALARAQKMLGRLARSGPADRADAAIADAAGGDPLALTLLRAVAQARGADQDAESALRGALTRLASGSM
jgi:XTP/dITP diphosphohydrolase